jgi:hypothetical protein
MGEASLPLGRATFLIGEASPPLVRATFLIGEASLPLGRATFLIGEASLPLGRATFLVGEASLPLGRATFLIGEASPPLVRATFLVGEAALPPSDRRCSAARRGSSDPRASSGRSTSTSLIGKGSISYGGRRRILHAPPRLSGDRAVRRGGQGVGRALIRAVSDPRDVSVGPDYDAAGAATAPITGSSHACAGDLRGANARPLGRLSYARELLGTCAGRSVAISISSHSAPSRRTTAAKVEML